MDSKGKTETLKEQVEAIAREPVSTAVNNMQNEYLQIAKRMRAMPLNVAGRVLNMLQTEFDLRQEETKNAIDEYKFQESVKRRIQEEEAAKRLAAEQAEIEEANRPRLVPAGQAPN
jgi:chromatin segregation and condensation protein Rec8/ScpA/Scc1 (kleisin family)